MFFITYYCIFAILELVKADSKPIPISLHADEILKSFQSIVSSDYIKTLANEFATKAAEQFIKEVKTNERKMAMDFHTRLRWRELLHRNEETIQPPKSDDVKTDTQRFNHEADREEWNKIHPKDTEKSPDFDVQVPERLVSGDTDKLPILNEEQAMTLLNDPSPDGDNLDGQLTDAEEETESKTIPVIGAMKINGVYYRRLLGMI